MLPVQLAQLDQELAQLVLRVLKVRKGAPVLLVRPAPQAQRVHRVLRVLPEQQVPLALKERQVHRGYKVHPA